MKRLLIALLMNFSCLGAFPGFYVGGAVGGHLTEGAQAGGVVGTFSDNVYPSDLQNDVFSRDSVGLLYAGYGVGWRSVYLGAEGFIQLGHAQLKNARFGNNLTIVGNAATFISSSEVESSINCFQSGVDFLPGWSLGPATLLYGRMGIGVARAKLEVRSLNVGQSLFGSGELFLNLSSRKTLATLRAGAGIEHRLTSHFSLRSDYIFTDYGKLSVSGVRTGTSSGFAFPMTLNSDTRLHLYDHAVLLGISYHFCCQEAICTDACSALSAFNGFYLGGAVGGSALTASQRGFASGENPSRNQTIQTLNAPSQLYNNQFQGLFFLGYGRLWKSVFLGGDVFVSAASHSAIDYKVQELFYLPSNDTLYATSCDTSVESSTCQYGFDLRPGVLLSPLTLLYARAGISAAEIRANSKAQFNANNGSGITWFLPEEVSARTWTAAFRLGLGVEQRLTARLHLRGDYVFTNYGIASFNSRATGQDSEGDATFLSNTLSTHLQNHAIFVGLTYYFR